MSFRLNPWFEGTTCAKMYGTTLCLMKNYGVNVNLEMLVILMPLLRLLETKQLLAMFPSMCTIFLRWGGTIYSWVNGHHRYSTDLPQGGLEIPKLAIKQENSYSQLCPLLCQKCTWLWWVKLMALLILLQQQKFCTNKDVTCTNSRNSEVVVDLAEHQ